MQLALVLELSVGQGHLDSPALVLLCFLFPLLFISSTETNLFISFFCPIFHFIHGVKIHKIIKKMHLFFLNEV